MGNYSRGEVAPRQPWVRVGEEPWTGLTAQFGGRPSQAALSGLRARGFKYDYAAGRRGRWQKFGPTDDDRAWLARLASTARAYYDDYDDYDD